MIVNDAKHWFFDMLPLKRKSALDWILPSTIGLGVGIAAGVGIGLLLAPEPGEVTRQKLRASANDLKAKALTLADRARTEVKVAKGELMSGARSSFDDMNQRR